MVMRRFGIDLTNFIVCMLETRAFFEHYVTSTMPYAQKWVAKRGIWIKLADAMLRGISEVMFMNNTITGVLMWIAVFIAQQYQALYMLIAVFTSTVTAHIFKLDIANGLFGYNAVLLQIGIVQYHTFDSQSIFDMPQILVPIILMSILSTILVSGLGQFLV